MQGETRLGPGPGLLQPRCCRARSLPLGPYCRAVSPLQRWVLHSSVSWGVSAGRFHKLFVGALLPSCSGLGQEWGDETALAALPHTVARLPMAFGGTLCSGQCGCPAAARPDRPVSSPGVRVRQTGPSAPPTLQHCVASVSPLRSARVCPCPGSGSSSRCEGHLRASPQSREGAGGRRRGAFKRPRCACCGPAARALIGRAGGARGGGGASHSQISQRLRLP